MIMGTAVFTKTIGILLHKKGFLEGLILVSKRVYLSALFCRYPAKIIKGMSS
jgi:hypothetical protein